ncbi:MAG: hypothetical protein U0235_23470 [Polyangiaceae bacterium]
MATADRPEEVPPSAKLDKKRALWRDGDEKSARERVWSHPSGMLLLDAPRKGGKLHGDVTWSLVIEETKQFADRVAMRKSLGLPEGPTNTVIATFVDGVLTKARFSVAQEDKLTVELSGGVVDGTLDWVVGPSDGPIFVHGATSIDKKIFKVPKPWPHRVRATFAKGKLKSVAFFKKDGAPLAAGPDAIADWGADASPATLLGYIERGDFAKDAKRFFPTAEPVSVEGLPKKSTKLAKLPAAHQASAKALDALARKGKLPYLGVAFDFSSYGFDCAEQDLYGAKGDELFGIASDGSGDMLLLDVTTGEVIPYAHEEGSLDRKTAFESLDACAFAMLRVEAAAKGLIPKAALTKTLKTLGLRAALDALGRV